MHNYDIRNRIEIEEYIKLSLLRRFQKQEMHNSKNIDHDIVLLYTKHTEIMKKLHT